MSKYLYLHLLLAGVCGSALSVPAAAQEAPIDDGESEIIVTAQNRAQNVNDVPIAIDVVSGEELLKTGFSNMNDIDRIAPAVQLNQDQGTVKITVRGVGTTSNDEAQDTSVVVNIDGEYMNRPAALGVALFDIDRVEVLRGPQGTLYGRNSTGGAINFITRKPGNDFGFNATASYGNYDAIRVDAGLDVPLGDIGGVRFAGFYDKRDGYVSHPARAAFGPFPAFAGGRSDDNDAVGGRVSLRLDPTDALSINVAAEYAKRDFTPQSYLFADLNAPGVGPTGPGCNASGFVQVAPGYPDTLCAPSNTNLLSSLDRGSYAAPNYGLGELHQDTYAVRGRVAYEFSDAATLTYTGGYRNFSGKDGVLALPVVYRSFGFENETDTQSHELRLNGEVGGVIYQLGGFYFKEKLASETGFFVPIGPNGTYLSYNGRNATSDSKSVFGQVEIPLGSTLTAVGGLRYTENSRKALYRTGSPFGAGPPDPYLFNAGPARKDFAQMAFVNTLNLAMKEDKVTWLAGVNYKPNSDTLVYAKVSTGFKGGGFDPFGNYRPETNTAYEGGWKQSFGDHSQHQFNLSGFYYDYRDLQVSVLLDTSIGIQVFNAGKATIWGIEASGDIKLSDNDRFSASFNYLNAQYDQLLGQLAVYCVGGCATTGVGDLDPNTPGIQQPDFSGNRPPFSPKFVITAGYEHVFNLGSAGTLTARANTLFKSAYFTDFFNYRDSEQTALTQTDLSLEYKPENRNWSIQAFVRNLENTRPLTYGAFVAAGPDDIYNWQFGAPRTYGLRVGLEF